MSILLYCVTTDSASPDDGPGVAGIPVLHCRQAGLDALFSRETSPESWTGTSLKQSAREFHNVLRRAFASHAIIPFRFPTLMRDEEELVSHLRDNEGQYSAQLKMFENSVQMDISIVRLEPLSPGASPASGAEYLRARQERWEDLQAIATNTQELAGETVQSWRNRPITDGLKLFALLNRAFIAAFHERLKELSVPPNLAIRMSGPWPVSEFLDLKQR